jgi:purine-binding chemotaxis protein CheW
MSLSPILTTAAPLAPRRAAQAVAARAVAATSHEAACAVKACAGEFLIFRLGADEYGIDPLRVQEVRSYEQPTRIANAPEFIEGVVILRGAIVPIVDLRRRLGCPCARCDAVVLVLHVRGRIVGAVVDSVGDVLALQREQIEPAPPRHASIDPAFVAGVGKVTPGPGESEGGRVLLLMDIEALLGSADIGLMQ